MKHISEFPSKQAKEIQKQLLELDRQSKLFKEFENRYSNNLGEKNSLARYIKDNWETRGKKLFMEYTGIEVYTDDRDKIKSKGIKLNEISYGSKRLMLWKCIDCSYEWVARPNDRTSGKSCPMCATEKSIHASHLRGEPLGLWCDRQEKIGEQLKREFLGKLKNGKTIGINDISKGSHEFVMWQCSNCGHIWSAMVANRTNTRGFGCPECAKNKRKEARYSSGEPLGNWCNRQGSYGAKIKNEFTGSLLDGTLIDINSISRGSHTKLKWKCSNCGYEYTMAPVYRTSSQRKGCPNCSGTQLITGINDLETYCKENNELTYLLKEFKGEDKEHNKILASGISRGSHTMVYWECPKCNNIWLASPNSRTKGTGCPYCAANTWTSFPEQFIYFGLKQLFQNIMSRVRDKIHNYEYDIAIPELKLCIEYSGYYYHQDKLDRDKAKEQLCKESSINFLQIYAYDTYNSIEKEVYTKEKIEYNVNSKKEQHIEQLKHIVEFILQEYAPEHTIEEIDFNLATNEANKIMGKA